MSRRKRVRIGEGSDRHTVIFEKGDFSAIFCPKAKAEISARPTSADPPAKVERSKPRYTPRQGQTLAFIHTCTKLNRQPPSEADIAAHFQITAPSAHGMVVTLTKSSLISREPGRPRSIKLLIDPAVLPPLA